MSESRKEADVATLAQLSQSQSVLLTEQQKEEGFEERVIWGRGESEEKEGDR